MLGLLGRLVWLMGFRSDYYYEKAEELHERERDIDVYKRQIDKSVYDRVIADAIEAYIQAKKREVPVVIITELLVAN